MSEIDDNTQRSILDTSSDAFLILALRIACLGLLGYWTLILIRPFLAIMVWSIIFTVAFYPFFSWLSSMLRGRRVLAAAAIVLVSLVILLGPATWLALSLADNVRTLVQRVADGSLAVPPPPESVKSWPVVGEQFYAIWHQASGNLKALLIEVGPHLTSIGSRLLAMAGNAGLNLLKFIVAVVISGFLFVPGRAMVIANKHMLSRVATERGEEFIDIAGATIRNVSRGVIGISLLQTLLAGIGLLIAEVPAAGLLSFLILILGIIQIGPTIVLIPLVIWSWFTMTTAAAVVFTAYMLVVGLSDNVLRPLVMAKGLSAPALVIFIGVIGGTIAHGLLGLFVGPIVLSIAWQLIVLFTNDRTEGNAPPLRADTHEAS